MFHLDCYPRLPRHQTQVENMYTLTRILNGKPLASIPLQGRQHALKTFRSTLRNIGLYQSPRHTSTLTLVNKHGRTVKQSSVEYGQIFHDIEN